VSVVFARHSSPDDPARAGLLKSVDSGLGDETDEEKAMNSSRLSDLTRRVMSRTRGQNEQRVNGDRSVGLHLSGLRTPIRQTRLCLQTPEARLDLGKIVVTLSCLPPSARARAERGRAGSVRPSHPFVDVNQQRRRTIGLGTGRPAPASKTTASPARVPRVPIGSAFGWVDFQSGRHRLRHCGVARTARATRLGT